MSDNKAYATNPLGTKWDPAPDVRASLRIDNKFWNSVKSCANWIYDSEDEDYNNIARIQPFDQSEVGSNDNFDNETNDNLESEIPRTGNDSSNSWIKTIKTKKRHKDTTEYHGNGDRDDYVKNIMPFCMLGMEFEDIAYKYIKVNFGVAFYNNVMWCFDSNYSAYTLKFYGDDGSYWSMTSDWIEYNDSANKYPFFKERSWQSFSSYNPGVATNDVISFSLLHYGNLTIVADNDFSKPFLNKTGWLVIESVWDID